MKVVVTGSSGFIGGRVVVHAQQRGHQVSAWTRKTHDLRQRDGVADALAGHDAVIHCAASLGVDAREQQADTVDATANLLAAMQQAGVKQIVGVSTFALYDYLALREDSVLDERAPLEEDFAARGPYILAKRKQEDMIRAAAREHELRATIIRPGIVFGPGRTWFHHLGMQLGAARWVCLAPEGLFPITHVDNCAAAIVLALEGTSAAGAILNVVDDDLPTRGRYVRELAARSTPRPSVSEWPWSLLVKSAASASFVNRALFFGRAPLPGLLQPASLAERCKPLRYDNARAKAVLGWQPTLSFPESLERSLR